LAGTVVTVNGRGLDAVTTAKIGSSEAPLVSRSANRIEIVVPTGATSGHIEASVPGGVALSAARFTAITGTPIPLLIAVSAETVPAGGRVTATGVNLEQVSQIRLGNTVLPLVSRGSTSLAMEVPAGALTGFLAIVDLAGAMRLSALRVAVVNPMAITEFSRPVVARDQVLRIEGVNLDRATSVIFSGAATASVKSRSGTTSLSVVVPKAASSGPVTVMASAGDTAVSSGVLGVIDPIVVTPATYDAALGAPVTLWGGGLAAVTAVTVGTLPTIIRSQSATHLEFSPPPGADCAEITLWSNSQDPVRAGTLAVGGGCEVRLADLEFAQVMSQLTTDALLRIVPGRETWLRAHVVSDFPGVVAPPMRAVGYSGNVPIGSVSLNGPATLPVLAATGVISPALRESNAQSFNAQLPVDWVRSGMKVRIEIDPLRPSSVTTVLDNVPVVGSQTAVDVVMVPLVSGTLVPSMPSALEVLNELTRRLPVARENILVSQRAAYSLTSVTNGVDTLSEWSAALAELESLRVQEAPGKQYYGMVRPLTVTGTSGIGYVNSTASPAMSALGWDATYSRWQRTMVHEFGHNYGRRHAPCGQADEPDPAYPYPGGVLGPTPLFDVLSNQVISATGLTDVMGYCNGYWFSDYNLREVQRFLEAKTPSTATDIPSADVLIVSGAMDSSGVRLAPVRSVRGRRASVQTGPYVLRLTLRGGAVIEKRFDVSALDHSRGEGHFLVEIPHPGELVAIDVRGEGRQIPVVSRGTVDRIPLRTGVGVASVDGPWASLSSRSGMLDVSWNGLVSPFATLTLVSNTTRRTLAINASGGKFSVPAASLPEGGVLEVSLSDGLNPHLVMLSRP
jgi:trimeric autotransporter adhesin